MDTYPASETVDRFAMLYAQSDDPWHIDRGWYEQRKRALLMACLPHERYDVMLEPGCGSGALSMALASRCHHLIACDIAPRAIELARERLASCGNVALSCQQIPVHWPAAVTASSIDCIVISELAYFLQPPALALLLARIKDCLKPHGVVVACHWQGKFAERTMDTSVIHAHIAATTGLHSVVHHEEHDFLLDVWSDDTRSVAMQEGLA